MNPFAENDNYENDPEGFIMPYKLYGQTDAEVMYEKYRKLKKSSYSLIVRLGIYIK